MYYRCIATSIVLTVFVITTNGDGRGSEKCSEATEALDTCLDGVEKSGDFKTLKKEEVRITKACVSQNSGTTCQIGSKAGDECRRKARIDQGLRTAKEGMKRSINNCFDGKISNPFAVLRMTGDMGATGKKKGHGGKHGGGGGRTTTVSPSGGGGDDNSFTGDSSDLSNSGSSGSGASGASQPGQNCPTPVDPSTALGGSSTDVSGTSGSSQPGDLLSGLGGGGLPGAAGGTDGSSPLDISKLFSGFGRRKRAAGAELHAACKPIYECMRSEKQKSADTAELRRAAARVYRDIQKCRGDHTPPLACIPNTAAQKTCVRDARKSYQENLKAFMGSCLNQQPDSQNGE